MPNPVFTLGANVITFPKGIDLPASTPREHIQAIDRTASGNLEVESLGTIIKRLPISFSNLPAATYAELLTWFETVAAGAANSFTYTDMDGVDHVVRWVNQFNFTETKGGFGGSIDLEVVG